MTEVGISEVLSKYTWWMNECLTFPREGTLEKVSPSTAEPRVLQWKFWLYVGMGLKEKTKGRDVLQRKFLKQFPHAYGPSGWQKELDQVMGLSLSALKHLLPKLCAWEAFSLPVHMDRAWKPLALRQFPTLVTFKRQWWNRPFGDTQRPLRSLGADHWAYIPSPSCLLPPPLLPLVS